MRWLKWPLRRLGDLHLPVDLYIDDGRHQQTQSQMELEK